MLEQTTSGYLDVCDSPEKCDEYLTKVMVQLEELEGRFAEFDEFVVQLAQRREDVYAAFESRKVQLVEKRNRRAESLAQIRYREGSEDFLTLLDAQRTQLSADDALAAAEAEVNVSVVGVYKALGGWGQSPQPASVAQVQ